MRIKEGFVLRQVCGEWVVVGEGLSAINFNRLLSLNETAAWLWEKAGEIGDFNTDTLTATLCEEYDVPTEDARQDVSNMIHQWLELGIVEP